MPDNVFEKLKTVNADTFYNRLKQFTFDLFEGNTLTLEQEKILNYILSSGVYIDEKNYYARNICEKGKFSVKLSRIFLSEKQLAVQYPRLKKHRILLPYYEIKRWFRIFNKGKRQKFAESSKTLKNLDKKSVDGFNELANLLGLFGSDDS